MIDVMRFKRCKVVSKRLSSGLKNDLLLLMCVVVAVFKSDMKEDSIGSIGCAGGFHLILFSIIGMVVEYKDGVGKKKDSLNLR